MPFLKVHSTAEFSAALSSTPIAVAYFGATWCGPCKRYGPAYERLAASFSDVAFIKIDADECRDVVGACGVKAFPTTLFFAKGVKQSVEVVGGDIAKVQATVQQLKAQVLTPFTGAGNSLGGGGSSSRSQLSAAQQREARLKRLGAPTSTDADEALARAIAASLDLNSSSSGGGGGGGGSSAAAAPPSSLGTSSLVGGRSPPHKSKVAAISARVATVAATIKRCSASDGGTVALGVVSKVIRNLNAHPTEAKYGSINMAGKTYRAKVQPVVAANELLLRLGFTVEGTRLVLTSRDAALLAAAHALLVAELR